MRIRDKNPKGLVTVKGSFRDAQHEQAIGLVKNVEERENQNTPLSQIMSIKSKAEGLTISTTDSHLPRGIGEPFKQAYRGNLELYPTKMKILCASAGHEMLKWVPALEPVRRRRPT